MDLQKVHQRTLMVDAHESESVHSWKRERNFEGPVEDRLAIRELMDSYADSITRRNVHLWASCWSQEGRWAPYEKTYLGLHEIVSHWVHIMKHSKGIKGSNTRLFLQFPGSIKVSGDSGAGWAYTSELLVDDNNMTYHLNGMYSDQYVREDGRWVFAERVFRKLHIDRPY